MKASRTQGGDPTSAFRAFFDGPIHAWAVFDDPFGTTRRRMTITGAARSEGGAIILDETIAFDDGETDARVWRLTPAGGGALEVKANDVRNATGAIAGDTLTLDYVFDLRVNGRIVPVRVEDKMTLTTPGVLIARSTFKKFGLPLGRMTAVFMRPDAAMADRSQIAA